MQPEQLLVDVIALSKQRCVSQILGELKYCKNDNLVGRPIDGYHPAAHEVCLVICKAAEALCEAQKSLNQQGYGLMVYEAYRPARALNDFKQWSLAPIASADELERKKTHYPHIEKNKMFELGYIAEDSRHCYGEAVDVFLTDLETNTVLDMGACFDFMDPISHIDRTIEELGETAFQHRRILRRAMEKAGFCVYPEEFWHFNYACPEGRMVSGPIDIPITPDLQGLGVRD